MTNEKRYSEMFWPFYVSKDQRILNENGEIETIYKIKNDAGDMNYVFTINNDNRKSLIFRTYFVNGQGEEIIIKRIVEKRKNLLKNLKKATLDHIENKMGLDALASQFN